MSGVAPENTEYSIQANMRVYRAAADTPWIINDHSDQIKWDMLHSE